MLNRKKAKSKPSSKITKLQLSDIDALFDVFHSTEALLTAAYEVLDNLDKKENWIALLLLEKGRKDFELLGIKLDRIDSQRASLRNKNEAHEGISDGI